MYFLHHILILAVIIGGPVAIILAIIKISKKA